MDGLFWSFIKKLASPCSKWKSLTHDCYATLVILILREVSCVCTISNVPLFKSLVLRMGVLA